MQRLAESVDAAGGVVVLTAPSVSASAVGSGQELAAEALAGMAAVEDEGRHTSGKRALPHGVYASGAGFGAELRKGGRRLCQDGFCSPAEAAQERALWKDSIEKSCRSATNSPKVICVPSACLPVQAEVAQTETITWQQHTLFWTDQERGGIVTAPPTPHRPSLQERFARDVMCDFTPRPPWELPMKQCKGSSRLGRGALHIGHRWWPARVRVSSHSPQTACLHTLHATAGAPLQAGGKES